MSDYEFTAALLHCVVIIGMITLMVLGVRAKVSDMWPRAHTPPKVTREPEPLPPHVGAYRANPRPQPTLPRKTPWWRLAVWWAALQGVAERVAVWLDTFAAEERRVESERASMRRMAAWMRRERRR